MHISRPLVVDLDGSLIRSDVLMESGLQFLHKHPFQALAPLSWLSRGRAAVKSELAQRVEIDVSLLPYEPTVLALIEQARADGRETVLATASHEKYARLVAAHLQCFDRVMATTESDNLKGPRKAQALVAIFGKEQFDYVGDSAADIPVWSVAHTAYMVNPGNGLARQVQASGRPVELLGQGRLSLGALARGMRLQHWAKNSLIFVPLLASHQLGNFNLVLLGLLAFLCFGLAASSVYLLNDLLDLQNDRLHPVKRMRPTATGELPIPQAILSILVCLAIAMLLSVIFLPGDFTLALCGYYFLTLAYTLLLKRIFLVDVMVLATLYTLRVVAGTCAFDTELTFWLLAFSMSLFLSLAMVKRYAELHLAQGRGVGGELPGRSYTSANQLLLASLGAGAGIFSVVVLGYYVRDEAVYGLYARPELIWLACPVLLAWITRVWVLAYRGEMQEDPVDFAIHDRPSLLLGLLFGGIFVGAL